MSGAAAGGGGGGTSGDSVKVAVRVRPFNQREKDRKATCCIEMNKDTQQTMIADPASGKSRKFTFDFSYNSFVPRDDPAYASQSTVWTDIGVGVLENAYEGYNCSLFAYGQTGAGKSYSMMGYGEDKGIIPIACEKIFDRIEGNTDDSLTIKVEASMLEIYMEKIRDLFNPKAGDLKIRNDPKKGFYVEKLTRNAVGNFASISKLMDAGTKARTVASTNMNATSSRAHTIFQIVLTQTKVDMELGKATDKVAIINLIDLAGSERQSGTGATGDRLKEGSAINLSLSSLGNCISALAHNSGGGSKKVRVPYRDSVLTMLLQNSLGGNAKTIMIAAISPADINHDETLSTLRYADRAKQIKNKAVVNEDPNEKLIRGLREEIENLRKALAGVGPAPGMEGVDMSSMIEKEREEMRARFEAEAEAQRQAIKEELEAKLRQQMEESKTWEERLKETDARQAEREAELRELGVVTGEEREAQIEKAKVVPHVLNLHEDPFMSEQIMHFFDEGAEVRIGREDAPVEQQIRLAGLGVEQQHAVVVNRGADGLLFQLATEGAKVLHNGVPLTDPTQLHHMDRLIIGNNHVFKVVIPAEAASYVPPEDVPAQIDHTFALMEQNKVQVKAMAEAEAKRRAEAEEARQKAEEQIREIERKMQEERERAEKEAQERARYYEEKEQELQQMREQGVQQELKEQEERLSREKEEMLKAMKQQQEELEKKLQEQIEETNRMSRRKEVEMKQRSLLDEELLKTIPLVNEANAYSEEMARGLTFTVKLMASPNKRRSDFDGKKDDDDDDDMNRLDTEVYVLVDSADGTSPNRLWPQDKFMDRLYTMREMYQAYIDAGRSLMGSTFLEPDSDPFYDMPEDLLLGRATVYLDPMFYMMRFGEWTPIIDYKGQTLGELMVQMIPHRTPTPPEADADEEDDDLDVDDIGGLKGEKIYVTIQVQAARGLPADKCTGNYVNFRFFLEEPISTEPTETKTINPKFNFQHTFPVVVTDEFVSYTSSETIDFDVWGRIVADRPASSLEGGIIRPYSSMGSPTKSVMTEMTEDMKRQVVEEERQRAEAVLEEQRQQAKAAEEAIRKELEEMKAKAKEAEEKAAQAAALQEAKEKEAAAARAEAAEANRRAELAAAEAATPAKDLVDAKMEPSPASSPAPAPASAPAQDDARIAAMQAEMEALRKQLADKPKKSSACAIL